MRITRIFFGIAMSIGLYITQITIVTTNQYIFGYEMTPFYYMLPIIFLISILAFVIISYLISENLYCKAYTIMGLIFGYIIYAFQISLLIRLLNLFLSLVAI